MNFTLRQLEVFVAIAKSGNVSRAADAISLSQSATSTALGEFERQFGVQMFDRVGKSLRLNGIGQQLLPRAVDLLDRANEVEELLEGRAGFGSLNIGATLTIGNYLTTLIVAKFLQRHPQSQVQLAVHNTATIVSRIARYELDLGLIEGDCNHPDLDVQPWIADELVVFCAPDHPLAGMKRVPLKRLLAEQWILREKGSGTRETFDRAMHNHHAQLQIRLELEHTEAIKRAVESGLGLGCISRLALKDAFRRGSLVPLNTPDLDLNRNFYFLRHKQKYQTAGMREFLALCREMTEGASRSDEIDLPSIA
ncbi:MAG: LysR family transcriptional regulator [Methylobacillus sp.]|jgi:DNA-binding transcriptional LysR family regulator|nr:LysR family transcriptional regulator [Methylobacillus sp.]